MGRTIEPEFVGRTYDDFLFRPQASPLASRREVSLRTRLTRRLTLELPLVSANMDSVTDARMAVAMALEGGLGFVHRGLPIAAQAAEVARVKRTQGHVVDRPFCLARGSSVREARELARRHNVTGLLVEEAPGGGVLAGLLSNRDWPWSAAQDDRPVEEFMTPVAQLVTGPPDISIEEAERRMFVRRVEKLPLVDGDGRIRGLITKKDILAARQRPYSSKDARGRLLVGAAIGARGDFLERAAELLGAGADALLIDIAHAHSEVMRRAVEAVRARFSGVELVCGNVATVEGAAFLRDLGADAIKVGVGPGRGCRTRLETGAGVPQLQAIREAWCAVEDDGADHRRRRGARGQGRVPCPRGRRLRRDAGEHALRHRRGAGPDHRGPGDGREAQDLPGDDLAPGRLPRPLRRRGARRGRGRPRGAGGGPGDAGAVPRLAWWTSSGGSAGICAPPSATAGRSRSPSFARRSCRTRSATWSPSRPPPAPNPTSADRVRL